MGAELETSRQKCPNTSSARDVAAQRGAYYFFPRCDAPPTIISFSPRPKLVARLFILLNSDSIIRDHTTMSLTDKLAITDVDLKGKRVLMRVSPRDTVSPRGKLWCREHPRKGVVCHLLGKSWRGWGRIGLSVRMRAHCFSVGRLQCLPRRAGQHHQHPADSRRHAHHKIHDRARSQIGRPHVTLWPARGQGQRGIHDEAYPA